MPADYDPDDLFCTPDDALSLLSELGLTLRASDAEAPPATYAELTDAEKARVTRAITYATERVKLFCCPHYDAADLLTSWLVNEWATVIAAHRLCARRLNPTPQALHELMFGEAHMRVRSGGQNRGVMGDLADVRSGAAQIPDVGRRNAPWLAWSNVTVDPRYRLRQIRVQRPISEGTPTQYAQDVDWRAENSWEF